jgi:hypothetical protein
LDEAKREGDAARVRAIAHACKGLFLNIGDQTGAIICDLVTADATSTSSRAGVLRRYVSKTLIVLDQQPEMRDQKV